jgi:hypothetical protein
MDTKLTTNQRKTSDYRIACSGYHRGSIAPPNGPGSRIIRERSSEDPGSEGSDRRRSSRRIQEGRPNRSGRVRPDPEIRIRRRPSPFPSRSNGLISKTYISCRSLPKRQATPATFSGPGAGGDGRGTQGDSCRQVAQVGQPHPRLLRPVRVWAEETGTNLPRH